MSINLEKFEKIDHLMSLVLDHLLQPVDNVKVHVPIDVAHIASVHPPLRVNGTQGLRRIIQIT